MYTLFWQTTDKHEAKALPPNSPERGSFPLDHDGDCKSIISGYLQCLRSHRGTNDEACRMMAKSYLQCRMDNNLMAPDEFKNLGFRDEDSGNDSKSGVDKASSIPNVASSTRQ
ncbi:cytochrome c oxidase assembly protein COX19 [Lineolata rhizophorae]|uniref:Cytochrome c oxidase assembly protein COX19 n=1 Tax=Lineolata rhizophorae TaxID=578093 RepID=A0A6A6PAD1_9PEZI|nr:cytochrome c oxidase assembly protein COX19 [Lineolata rhizophorae]